MVLRPAFVKATGLKILITAILFSFLIALLFPVRNMLVRIITESKMQAIEMLEERLNHKIIYSSIAPSILHAFEIRDFAVLTAESPHTPLLEIERIRLGFSLLDFRFDDPLNAFQGLLLVNSKIFYDSERNTELINLLKSLTSNERSSDTASSLRLPDDFFIRGRNISMNLRTLTFNTDLSRMFFSLKTSPEGDIVISLKTDGSAEALSLPENLPVDKLSISTGLSINGRIDKDFNWVDLNIQTKNLESNLISIDKIAWNLKFENTGLISLKKTGDSIPVDISIDADTAGGLYTVDLHAQEFIFNRYFDVQGFLNEYQPLLDASINGNAELAYSLPDEIFEYSGDIEILNISGLIDAPVDASLIAKGSGGYISIEKSSLSSDIGTMNFSGTVELSKEVPLINGRLDIPGIRYNDNTLYSSLNLSSSIAEGYQISAYSTVLNGLPIEDLKIELKPYDDNIEFTLNADIATTDDVSDNIYSEGILQLGGDYYIQSVLTVENLLLEPVIDASPVNFKLPDILSEFDLTTELYISGSLDQLSFASSLIKLKDRFNENRSLTLSLSGNNSGVRLSNLNLKWDENSLTGKISSDIAENGSIILQTMLDFNGAAINTAGVYSKDGNISLAGDYGLKFNLFAMGAANSFSLKSERLPLNSAEQTSFLSLNITGYFSSIDNWKILLNDISVEELSTGFGSGKITLSAFLSQNGGNIYNLQYSDGQTELKGGGSLMLTRILPEVSGRLHLNAASELTNESYSALLSFRGEEIDGNVDFNNFPINRITENGPLDGDFNGGLSIAGSIASPQLRLLIDTQNAAFNNEQLNLAAAFYYDSLNLQVENINATFGAYYVSDIRGLFNLASGQHQLIGNIVSENSMIGLTAGFELSAESQSIDSLLNFPDILKTDYRASLTVDDVKMNDEPKSRWIFQIEKQENLLNIIGGVNNEIVCNFFEDGYFSAKAAAPFPIRLTAAGTISDGNINAEISDINYVFKDLHIPYLIFYEGDFTGKLRLQGPLNDPDFYGQLDFHQVVFKPPIVQDITEPFDTSFFLSGKELKLPASRLKTNNGLAFVSITASMERWLPRNYDLKVNVAEGESLSARFYVSPFYVYGFAEGFLHLYGDLSHMWVEGELLASDAVFMLSDSIELASIGSPTEFITADLNIIPKENNQFFWPNQDVPIVKGYLSSDNKLRMQYDTIDGLLLSGDMSLKGGEIFYFERNFYIKEGGITFNNDSFLSMDPRLNVRAEIRDINSEGEMAKIYLIVDPSPLSSFTPRFESEPAMSTAEILSLIGGNIFDSFESENFVLTDAVLLTTDVLAQFAIMRNIEDGLKSTLGLDLLSIRSSFFSNFLENTVFTSSEDGNIAGIAEYLDNTTLFLGKYFSDDIFLQGMFQFDLYNDTGYSDDLNMNIDSEIKLEWEGPVANVELNFYPDFQDPIEGLNQTSLGLSWRFSY